MNTENDTQDEIESKAAAPAKAVRRGRAPKEQEPEASSGDEVNYDGIAVDEIDEVDTNQDDNADSLDNDNRQQNS